MLASFAACTPARPLGLPPADGAKLLILAVEDSQIDPPALFVGDPEHLSVDLYVPLDERTRLTALLYDRTADELDIAPGWLYVDPFDDRPLPSFSRGYQVTVGAHDPDQWERIDQLPTSLEHIRLPAQNIDRCFESDGCFDGPSCTHTCPLDQPDPPKRPDEPAVPRIIVHALPCELGEGTLALAGESLCVSDPCAHGCGTEIECPADGWPLVQEGPGVFFVDSDAIGVGDGTRAAPFRSIDIAFANGAETIVLRKGSHAALGLQVDRPLEIVGACLGTYLGLGFVVRSGATLSLKTLSVYVEGSSGIEEGATLTSTDSEVLIDTPTVVHGGRVELFATRLILRAPFGLARSTLNAADSRIAGMDLNTIFAGGSTISISRSIINVAPDLEGSKLWIEDTLLAGGPVDGHPAPTISVALTSRVELRRAWFDNMSMKVIDGDVAGEDVIALHGGSNSWIEAHNASTVFLQRLLLGAYLEEAPSIAMFGDSTLSVGNAHVFGKSIASAERTHIDIAAAVFQLSPGERILLGGADVSISDLLAWADEGLEVQATTSAQLNRVDITASASPGNVDRTSTGLAVREGRATLEDIRVQGAEHGMFVQSQGLTMTRFDVRGVSVGATLVDLGPLMLVGGYIEGEAQGLVLRDFGSTFISDLLQFVRVQGPIDRER